MVQTTAEVERGMADNLTRMWKAVVRRPAISNAVMVRARRRDVLRRLHRRRDAEPR